MTAKERILEQIEAMNDSELVWLEQYLSSAGLAQERDIDKTLELVDRLGDGAENITAEDWQAFDEAVARRPLFGGRPFPIAPDDEDDNPE